MSKTCLINATEVIEYAAQFIDVSVDQEKKKVWFRSCTSKANGAWDRSKPTLAKPTLAILIRPTVAKPTLAKVKVLFVCKDFGSWELIVRFFFEINCSVFFCVC